MRAFPHCATCGRSNGSPYRNCEDCRASWRNAKRKPGGPAEQREILAGLVQATESLLPHAMDAGDDTAVFCARRAIAKAKGALRR